MGHPPSLVLGPPRRRIGRPKSYRWRSEAGSNVLLDVLQNDATWAPWSQEQLDAAAATESLAINPIIYSELSMAFARIEELDTVIEEASLNIEAIPKEALFLAGKVFLTYRENNF